jgi:hypothetical protein
MTHCIYLQIKYVLVTVSVKPLLKDKSFERNWVNKMLSQQEQQADFNHSGIYLNVVGNDFNG